MDISKQALYVYLASFLLLLTATFSCKPSSHLSKHQDKLSTKIEQSQLFSKAFSGFAIYDLQNKKPLFEKNGDKLFTPASNTKIATLLASIEFLGDSLPVLQYHIKEDSLFFRGSGNPLNLNPYISDNQQVLDFLRAYPKLQLIYVPHSKPPNRYGSGWAWDDYLYYYQLDNSAFPIFGNQVELKIKGDSISTVPNYFESFVEAKKDSLIHLYRAWDSNDFEISYKDSTRMLIPFKWQDSLALTLLTNELESECSLQIEAPESIEWTSLKIPFPDSLYVLLMQESDNFIAEQLLITSAGLLSDTLEQSIVIRAATAAWEPVLRDTMRWVDGSGLSRYNLFTPYTFVQLLERIHSKRGMDWIKSVFPQGGESGTINDWYFPYVYAKTGTLSNNHNLSGYIETKGGKVLIFSFMHNHFMGSNKLYKKEMEMLLKWIHENY